MTLNRNHLELAKSLSKKVWKDPRSDWAKNYIEEKITAMDKASTDNPENIWFFINQFDTRRILKLWHLAKTRGTSTGTELAEFIETEYFQRLENELGVKVV